MIEDVIDSEQGNTTEDSSSVPMNKYNHPKERKEELSKFVIENDKIIENNKAIWNCHRDKALKQLVIMFSFDFEAIENVFDGLLGIESGNERKVLGKNELRRHWGFLHSMRLLGKKVDEEYYINLSIKKDESIRNKVYSIEESNDDFINKLFDTKVSSQMMKEYENELNTFALNKKENEAFPLQVSKNIDAEPIDNADALNDAHQNEVL